MNLQQLKNKHLKELQLLERGTKLLKGEALRELWESIDKLQQQHNSKEKQWIDNDMKKFNQKLEQFKAFI
jgi:hypothetical protein